MEEVSGSPAVHEFSTFVDLTAHGHRDLHLLEVVAHQRLRNLCVSTDRILSKRVSKIAERKLNITQILGDIPIANRCLRRAREY